MTPVTESAAKSTHRYLRLVPFAYQLDDEQDRAVVHHPTPMASAGRLPPIQPTLMATVLLYPTSSMPYRRASAANCSMSGWPVGEALVNAAASSK